MNRVWTGVVAGVLAAALLLTVGIGAYQAGQDDEVVTRVVTDGSESGGEVVRVIDNDGWRHGPGPGFILFPLLFVLLIFVFARRGRWHHGYGHGPGWHRGYGPDGPGGPCGDRREGWMQDWHRRAHEGEVEGDSPPPTTPTPTAPMEPA